MKSSTYPLARGTHLGVSFFGVPLFVWFEKKREKTQFAGSTQKDSPVLRNAPVRNSMVAGLLRRSAAARVLGARQVDPHLRGGSFALLECAPSAESIPKPGMSKALTGGQEATLSFDGLVVYVNDWSGRQ